MWKLLDRPIRFWLLFWSIFITVNLLVVLQEAAFFFYGPISRVQGVHLHEKHVGSAWQYSILYFFIPLAWWLAWRSKVQSTKIWIAAAIVVSIPVIRFLIDQMFSVHTGNGALWVYHTGPGTAWYGNVQSQILLSVVADPIQYMKLVALGFAVIPWIALFNSDGIRQRRFDEARLTKVCFYCNYDMRGSSDRDCPECGKRQPLRGEI